MKAVCLYARLFGITPPSTVTSIATTVSNAATAVCQQFNSSPYNTHIDPSNCYLNIFIERSIQLYAIIVIALLYILCAIQTFFVCFVRVFFLSKGQL